MTPIKQFRLGRVDPHRQAAQLIDAHDRAAAMVDGVVLEAQFEVADGYLIVTTDGDPFEDCLHFSLFGRGLDKVDGLSLGLPYNTGTFRLCSTAPGDALRFSFFTDEVWQLEVLHKARLVLGRRPASVWYSSGFWRRHRLVLARLPLTS